MAAVKHFDCVVLGGGSGGIAFARRAATYGAKVALVEYNRMGGTCVNVGCVPKKIMWCAANAFESLHGMKHLGVDLSGPPRFNWERLVENRENYIKRLNRIYETNLDKSQIERFYGWGSLAPNSGKEQEAHVVVVNATREYTENGVEPKQKLVAKHVLVATGGRPSPLSIPGASLCTDSDGFFALVKQPQRVGVIGAGYIAVELSGVLQAVGTETHLFVRGEMALRKFDVMIQQQNDKNLKALGIHVHPHSTPKEIYGSPGAVYLKLENGTTHGPFDCLINAIGRTPEVEGLGLDRLGVRMVAGNNYVETDEFQNTSVKGIFALGDVCGKIELTPMAIAAGRRLADRLYGKMEGVKADYSFVPSVIFAHPPIATIGLTEAEAKEQYGEEAIKIYEGTCVNLMYGAYQIPPEEKPRTVIKLICNRKENERILGLHVVGMAADEMMQGFGVAIKMGATKADFDNCVAIHPTASEEVVTLHPWGLSGSEQA